MIRTKFFAIAAFSTVSAFAVQAFAASEEVEYDRAYLDDPAYVEELYGKIVAAAHRVCEAELKHAPARHELMDECLEVSVKKAVEQADSPELDAYAESGPAQEKFASAR